MKNCMAAIAVLMIGLTWIGCQTINPIPVPTPTPTTTTTTVPPVVATSCDCDLSRPVVQPPISAADLAAAGQSQECPVFYGMDIRFFVHRTDAATDWAIAQPFKDSYQFNSDGTITIKCPTDSQGITWHVQGWHQQSADRSKMTAGNTFKYVGPTMCVFAECLGVKP